ncbi:MAG: HNH endonuclease [Crenarchaeota archaeon]|jgi:hypothetical protein|nr:HNH endonuclease [Thermoproteota archaeon]
MDAFEKLVLKYEKQGYKRENKKSLKYGVRYFFRLRKGLLGWDQGAYIYSPNANSSTESMREFLTDYEKYCDEDDGYPKKGLFFCYDCDEKLFKDLKLAMIRDKDLRNTIKLAVSTDKDKSKNRPSKAITPKENRGQRDIRRAFAQTQKNEILFQQDGKCAECHKKLDPRTVEFDHKEPWASGGRTVTINGRALCVGCHKIISHRHRLKQVDK